MAKLTLPRLAAGFDVDVINTALAMIEAALDNTVSRDGTLPNSMTADLDLNGRTLLNTGDSDDPNRVVTFSQMNEYIAGLSSGIVVQRQETQTATLGQSVFTLTSLDYVPGSYNLAVYVDGVRVFAPTDYDETSSETVDFVVPMSGGESVTFVTNEYLGSVTLPSHTHPWSQITNVPEFTTRWPSWDEVTSKPATFTPSSHTHAAGDIVSGRLADARRGVFVQASTPASPAIGDLWFWS